MKRFVEELTRGVLWKNPSLMLLLGLCPLLAASTTLAAGLGMGASVTVVLVLSSVVISLVGRFIPDRIKSVSYMVIIACFVNLVELLMHAYLPGTAARLGVYLPLVAVSGIVFAHTDSADKKKVGDSALSGLIMGLGFTAVILVMSFVRELLGSGTIFGIRIFPEEYGMLLMSWSAGGFIMLGLLVALVKKLALRFEKREDER